MHHLGVHLPLFDSFLPFGLSPKIATSHAPSAQLSAILGTAFMRHSLPFVGLFAPQAAAKDYSKRAHHTDRRSQRQRYRRPTRYRNLWFSLQKYERFQRRGPRRSCF